VTGDLSERMQEVRTLSDDGATYYQGLILAAGGGLDSAARADFVVDGRYTYADLRRAPFASRPELKQKIRELRALQQEVSGEIISIAFEARRRAEPDQQDRSDS
jgi:hypothetical protein